MSKSMMVRARMEPDLKHEVDQILEALGLTASEAIQMLFRQIKLRQGLPFNVRLPNERTLATLRRSRSGKGIKHFASKKALYADLGL